MTAPVYRVDIRGSVTHSYYARRDDAEACARDLIALGVPALVVEEHRGATVYGDAYRRMARHFPEET